MVYYTAELTHDETDRENWSPTEKCFIFRNFGRKLRYLKNT